MDYKELLKKYMVLVSWQEGTTFVDYANIGQISRDFDTYEFTKADIDCLKKISDSLNE
jgi:hypothetical protein